VHQKVCTATDLLPLPRCTSRSNVKTRSKKSGDGLVVLTSSPYFKEATSLSADKEVKAGKIASAKRRLWSPTNYLQQEVQRIHQVVAQIANVWRSLFLQPLMQTREKTTSTLCTAMSCIQCHGHECEECNKWEHVECARIEKTPETFYLRLLCCIQIGTC